MSIRKMLSLSTRSNFSVAIAAINRSVTARLERDLGACTALGASRGEHLARGSITAICVAISLPCLTAFGTTLGLVGEAFILEKFLFLGTESKCRATIGTLEGFVLKIHWMTSLRNIS